MRTSMAEEFIDVHDLRRRYKLPVSWWYSKAERGALPSFKIGKYRRFRASEVEAWLETQRSRPVEVRSRPR
jgi:excisionase family DNA binding protein